MTCGKGLVTASAYVKLDYPSKEKDGKYPVAKQADFLPMCGL